ncbi:hypothetical protein ACB296_20685, partial [Escherichia coli]
YGERAFVILPWALLSYKRFTGHMTFTMCVNFTDIFQKERNNILTNDKVFKAGLRRKMRKAAMDRNYLASVLTGSGLS